MTATRNPVAAAVAAIAAVTTVLPTPVSVPVTSTTPRHASLMPRPSGRRKPRRRYPPRCSLRRCCPRPSGRRLGRGGAYLRDLHRLRLRHGQPTAAASRDPGEGGARPREVHRPPPASRPLPPSDAALHPCQRLS